MRHDKETQKSIYHDYIDGMLFKELRGKYCIDSSVFFEISLDYYIEDILKKNKDDIITRDINKAKETIKKERNINKILNKMTLNGKRPTREEVETFIEEHAGLVSTVAMAKPLGCPFTAIKKFMDYMGIDNNFVQYRKNNKGLTLAQEEILFDLANGLKKKEIAHKKSITPGCVSGYINRIKNIIGKQEFDKITKEGKVKGVMNLIVKKSGKSEVEIEKTIKNNINNKLNKEIAAQIGCGVSDINKYFKLKSIVNEMNMITMDYEQRREVVIKKVKELNEKGIPLYSGYIKRHYRREIYNRADMFGSYKNLIEAAGIDYNKVCLWKVNRKYRRGYWTKERVIAKGKELSQNDLTPKKLCEIGESGFYKAIRKYFGSVSGFAEYLGYEYCGRENTNVGQKRHRKVALP